MLDASWLPSVATAAPYVLDAAGDGQPPPPPQQRLRLSADVNGWCPRTLSNLLAYCSLQMSRGADADLDLLSYACSSIDWAESAPCTAIVRAVREQSTCCDPCLCLPSCAVTPPPPPPPPPAPCREECVPLEPCACAASMKRLRKWCYGTPEELRRAPLSRTAVEAICLKPPPSPPPLTWQQRAERTAATDQRAFGCLEGGCELAAKKAAKKAAPNATCALGYEECASLLAALAEGEPQTALCLTLDTPNATAAASGKGLPPLYPSPTAAYDGDPLTQTAESSSSFLQMQTEVATVRSNAPPSPTPPSALRRSGARSAAGTCPIPCVQTHQCHPAPNPPSNPSPPQPPASTPPKMLSLSVEELPQLRPSPSPVPQPASQRTDLASADVLTPDRQ